MSHTGDRVSVIRSCGFLVMCRQPRTQFLLMKHANRWDFPKGHVDPGETDLECAWRELEEETGFDRLDVEIDERFEFECEYTVQVKRFDYQPRQKTLRVYLGWLESPAEVQPTEHIAFQWFPWSPPHRIQEKTIDPLLAAVEQHLSTGGA